MCKLLQISKDVVFDFHTGRWSIISFVVIVVQSLSCVWLFCNFLCSWDFPGKNTGVGCHFLLQGIFLIQRLNLPFLHGQVDSLPLIHQENPRTQVFLIKKLIRDSGYDKKITIKTENINTWKASKMKGGGSWTRRGCWRSGAPGQGGSVEPWAREALPVSAPRTSRQHAQEAPGSHCAPRSKPRPVSAAEG